MFDDRLFAECDGRRRRQRRGGHGYEHCCDDEVDPVGSNANDRSVGGLLLLSMEVEVGGVVRQEKGGREVEEGR